MYIRSLFAVALCCFCSSAGAGSLSRADGVASVPGIGELLEQARAEGEVRVIIGLDVPFMAEGWMSTVARERQRQAIARAQTDLEARMRGSRSAVTARFKAIPYMALAVDAAGMEALLRNPRVVSINADHEVEPTLASSHPVIGSAAAWAAGYDGSGWVVANLGTGVDKGHPWFAGKVVSEACYSTNYSTTHLSVCPGGVSESTATGSGVPFDSAVDSRYWHETHTAGISSGNGTVDGVCDGTTLGVCGVGGGSSVIAIQVYTKLASGGITSTTSDITKGLERVYELRESHDIASLNLSMGAGRFYDHCDSLAPSIAAAVANLRSAGIATVISTGNNFYRDSINYPGCISGVVSVGATYDDDNLLANSNIAGFMSLLAPGVGITSAFPGGTTFLASGTSMAAPQVAGAWAVLKQAATANGVEAGVDTLLDALRETGTRIDFAPVTDMRRINLDLAVARLIDSVPRAEGVVIEGILAVGETLAGAYLFVDPGGDPESGSTYRWQVADDGAGGNAADIPGAAATTFVPAAEDLAGYLRFCITPSDGSSLGSEACSRWRRPAREIFVDRSVIGGAGDGSSWPNAFAFLQDGLGAAEAGMGDTLSIAEGLYYPDQGAGRVDGDRGSTFTLIDGVRLIGGYPTGGGERSWTNYRTILSGDLGGDDSQQPLVTDPTTATGMGDNARHVVTAEFLEEQPHLEGLYITAGYADGGSSPDNDGGGLYLWKAAPTLRSVVIQGNYAADDGAGAFIGLAEPDLREVELIANLAGGSGGGIHNYHAAPTLEQVTLSGNEAYLGGGLANTASSPTLTALSVQGNRATWGGGIANSDLAGPSIRRTLIQGNEASDSGGGIYNELESSPDIVNCLISGNVATNYGGGLYNFGYSSPQLSLTTVSGNYADYGGAFLSFEYSTPLITNSILWGNDASTDNPTAYSDPTSPPTYGHSLVQGSGGSGAWAAGFGVDAGGNLDLDPLFAGPITPGWTPSDQGDFRLQAGTPAADAGDNGLIIGEVPLDLAARPRISPTGGTVDMGAYELRRHILAIDPAPLHGTVTDGNGLSCGSAGTGACSAVYDDRATLALTATPDGGSLFHGWGGDCVGTDNPFVIETVAADMSCSALMEPAPDLALQLAGSIHTVAPGDTLLYQIQVENLSGGSAAAVTVDLTLPSGVTLLSTTGCAEDPAAIPRCSLGNLAGNGSVVYTVAVEVTASPGEGLSLSGIATTSYAETLLTNNTATLITPVATETDSDGDGIPDSWESAHGMSPTDPADAALDKDGDGLSALEEYQRGSDPLDNDTDADGLFDGWDDDPVVMAPNGCSGDQVVLNAEYGSTTLLSCRAATSVLLDGVICRNGARVGVVAPRVSTGGSSLQAGCRMHWVTPEAAAAQSHGE